MIDSCPHCGRAVASDEYLARTRSGVWVPTACAAGDGPLCVSESERVRNHSFWFVSCIDGPRRYLAAGPYPTCDAAREAIGRVKLRCETVDPRCIWYEWGTASSLHPQPAGRAPFGAI